MFFDRFSLPKSVYIDNKEYRINYRAKDILKIFEVFNDPNLLDQEKYIVALHLFFVDEPNYSGETTNLAIQALIEFINGSKSETTKSSSNKDVPLYDWEQDFNIIIAPINHILGFDVRENPDLHWWTFLSAFMEIGESTFSTYVSIRDKKAHHKKLDKWEEKLYKENKDSIDIKKKYDDVTEMLMKEIIG